MCAYFCLLKKRIWKWNYLTRLTEGWLSHPTLTWKYKWKWVWLKSNLKMGVDSRFNNLAQRNIPPYPPLVDLGLTQWLWNQKPCWEFSAMTTMALHTKYKQFWSPSRTHCFHIHLLFVKMLHQSLPPHAQ